MTARPHPATVDLGSATLGRMTVTIPERSRPGRSLRRGAAIGLAGAVAWSAVTAWRAIVHSHPAYLVILGLVMVVALVLALRRPPMRHRLRVVRVGLLALAWVLAVATVVYFRPIGAEPLAVAAMEGTATVRVDEQATAIVLRPVGARADLGVAFYSGGLVEPRAYAAILTPVAEAGYPVVIIKPPLNIGLTAIDAAAAAPGLVPDGPTRWVVGGHSLGGTTAGFFADRNPTTAGLFFWASFPAASITSYPGSVLSVYGTQDGASTPERVRASATDLPQGAQLVPVEGANHAHFGDYGPQAGDNPATISREDAQQQIAEATLAWLATL